VSYFNQRGSDPVMIIFEPDFAEAVRGAGGVAGDAVALFAARGDAEF